MLTGLSEIAANTRSEQLEITSRTVRRGKVGWSGVPSGGVHTFGEERLYDGGGTWVWHLLTVKPMFVGCEIRVAKFNVCWHVYAFMTLQMSLPWRQTHTKGIINSVYTTPIRGHVLWVWPKREQVYLFSVITLYTIEMTHNEGTWIYLSKQCYLIHTCTNIRPRNSQQI